MERLSKLSIIAIIILFLSVSCIFAGISYAIFSYFGAGMTNNVIQTGRVVFSYSDANGGGNGIFIENAIPITDDMGKILSGESEYFDFNVSASTTATDLVYEITVDKDASSTLADDQVKIYLTSFEGTTEKETELTLGTNGVLTYGELKDTDNTLLNGKTVYYGTVQAGEIAYSQRFRLRMWVKMPEELDFDYTQLNDKRFSLKVNVAAVGSY